MLRIVFITWAVWFLIVTVIYIGYRAATSILIILIHDLLCFEISRDVGVRRLIARPHFNIKMPSYRFRRPGCGDEMITRLSFFYSGILLRQHCSIEAIPFRTGDRWFRLLLMLSHKYLQLQSVQFKRMFIRKDVISHHNWLAPTGVGA